MNSNPSCAVGPKNMVAMRPPPPVLIPSGSASPRTFCVIHPPARLSRVFIPENQVILSCSVVEAGNLSRSILIWQHRNAKEHSGDFSECCAFLEQGYLFLYFVPIFWTLKSMIPKREAWSVLSASFHSSPHRPSWQPRSNRLQIIYNNFSVIL